MSDIIPLIGHGLCIKENEYTDYGYMFLILYYLLYIIRHEMNNLDDKIKLIGCIFIIYYYLTFKNKYIKK